MQYKSECGHPVASAGAQESVRLKWIRYSVLACIVAAAILVATLETQRPRTQVRSLSAVEHSDAVTDAEREAAERAEFFEEANEMMLASNPEGTVMCKDEGVWNPVVLSPDGDTFADGKAASVDGECVVTMHTCPPLKSVENRNPAADMAVETNRGCVKTRPLTPADRLKKERPGSRQLSWECNICNFAGEILAGCTAKAVTWNGELVTAICKTFSQVQIAYCKLDSYTKMVSGKGEVQSKIADQLSNKKEGKGVRASVKMKFPTSIVAKSEHYFWRRRLLGDREVHWGISKVECLRGTFTPINGQWEDNDDTKTWKEQGAVGATWTNCECEI